MTDPALDRRVAEIVGWRDCGGRGGEVNATGIACTCGHPMATKGIHHPYCERMAQLQTCRECDRLRSQLARLVEAARAVLDFVPTPSGTSGTPYAAAVYRLRAVLDEIEKE